jgi:superfamily II DNA helicase RecQ
LKAGPAVQRSEDGLCKYPQYCRDQGAVVCKAVAQERSIPAHFVFSDAALRDMARKRPCTPSGFLGISGVGDKKPEQYGEVMPNLILRSEVRIPVKLATDSGDVGHPSERSDAGLS